MTALNISRLILFIRRQVTINIYSFWIALGAIVGILLIITVMLAYFNPHELGNLKGMYLAAFYLAGLIFTSKIFNELHTPQKSYALLTLPVSNLEKLLGSWLLTAPIFVVVYLLFMGILTSISSLIAGTSSAMVHIFDEGTWTSVAVYMVVQTIFFLGACTFKGNNFLKTLFAVFVFAVAVGTFAGVLFLILFDIGRFEDMDPQFNFFLTDKYVKVVDFLFWYVLGPFMVLVSYFKLKERQV